jgi:NitT/TauT family transport system substrate-binding protein
VMNKAAYNRTAQIAKQFKVISKAPSADAYRTDIAQRAVDELDAEGVDVNGSDWKKENIKVTPGGS